MFRLKLAAALALAFPLQAFAYISDDVTVSPNSLDERVGFARATCLSERYVEPRITFDDPRGIYVELYDTSFGASASMAVYRPLTHGLGGIVQSGIDWVLGEGDAARSIGVLRSLGREARRFARARGLTRMESLCLAGCITNQLMEGTEEIPHMYSLELALADGAGDCKSYAEAMLVLADEMDVELDAAFSYRHAFNRYSNSMGEFFYDATVWESHRCNFVRTSFYD